MPRDYDRDYNEDTTDYKRKRREEESTVTGVSGASAPEVEHTTSHAHAPLHDTPLNEKANSYLQECLMEKKSLEKKHVITKRLLDDEVEKILVSGRIPKPEIYANVYSEKPIRVAQKVLFPIKEYPKFNFVGKILGPKGNTLRQLQEETMCKMVVMGRNSMRDHGKEEELRSSGNPKYAHLSRDLHVEISTVAPPAEAYHRLGYALGEIRKFMIPDANDDIRLEQLREMDGKERMYKKSHHYSKSYGEHGAYSTRTPPPTSSKPKVYSILEKARYVMDDPNYGIVKTHRSRDHELYDHHGEYDRYATPPPPTSKHSSGHHAQYDSSYERDYRREYHPHSSSSSYAAAYAAKPSNGRSSSSYRPTTSGSGSHSSAHYETGSRSRESVRYRSAPYPKMR
ncbi:KH domain-containing, RNA-binding, signal transduction-associated protein 2 isoform X2 [Scaptodrosophila lebanonensis]|uniref:KH domain-containing, RNA-binding, signal transduction-associated protein 2 isoform X2 n=1 Tax=Drosophila lebanonensis TaxID=7225 RepID=A0A6J2TGD2_DROLE|nr:KH domain-containing, RNA-binding, signal transduction-associated protein 2 isoform X2 [Scaptodrosophila lebanonensis]